jgi:hypothetical protein
MNAGAQGGFIVIQASRSGRPFLIVVDSSLDSRKLSVDFSEQISIYLPIRNPNASGLCDELESDRLSNVEDRLLDSLADNTYVYVGRVTGNGEREVMIYARDSAAAISVMGERSRNLGENVEFSTASDPEWDAYHQLVP